MVAIDKGLEALDSEQYASVEKVGMCVEGCGALHALVVAAIDKGLEALDAEQYAKCSEGKVPRGFRGQSALGCRKVLIKVHMGLDMPFLMLLLVLTRPLPLLLPLPLFLPLPRPLPPLRIPLP